ncbi:hypothetical protein UFOVP247_152 [uncultured Caudovirales phage]|uniref:Uncharacterized protein n=1 Tax=uncultured Caudovirales phage TaxID=2100421 RepID=A0A6J7WZ92_9CAUD|nr:hypothetical protein UFOVP247_152 [uncultured Caudovirales phage]
MNINEAMSLSIQLETLVSLARQLNCSREELSNGVLSVAKNLKDLADNMDREMSDYFAAEQYEDKIVAQGVQ